jgi:hypothetical protein
MPALFIRRKHVPSISGYIGATDGSVLEINPSPHALHGRMQTPEQGIVANDPVELTERGCFGRRKQNERTGRCRALWRRKVHYWFRSGSG